jgi:hypothetical protein
MPVRIRACSAPGRRFRCIYVAMIRHAVSQVA